MRLVTMGKFKDLKQKPVLRNERNNCFLKCMVIYPFTLILVFILLPTQPWLHNLKIRWNPKSSSDQKGLCWTLSIGNMFIITANIQKFIFWIISPYLIWMHPDWLWFSILLISDFRKTFCKQLINLIQLCSSETGEIISRTWCRMRRTTPISICRKYSCSTYPNLPFSPLII